MYKKIDMNETEKKELERIKRSLNPKTKVRRVYKIEEDGSKTKARVIDLGHKIIFHNEEGPTLVNKEQKRKEYYLNGIEYSFDDSNEIMKGKEGLPWYKNPAFKGSARF